MRVAVRADASIAIGSGHLMRCRTLADRLRDAGAAVRFVCREGPGDRIDWLRECGYDTRVLPARGAGETREAEALDPAWAEDARQTAAALDGPVDWLIVDHYGLAGSWESALRAAARRILAIDDLANRDHDCDALLDQNLHRDAATRYHGRVPEGCRRLLGPHHALLRPEFRAARMALRERREVRRVLVFFGGSDAGNETGKALEALRALGRPDLAVDVIAGAAHPHFADLQARTSTLARASLYRDPADVAGIMAAADLSIGAAGSTSWERCCLGLPSIVIALAPNQEPIARGLEEAGLAVSLGRSEAVSPERIAEALRELIGDGERLSRLSRAGAACVDGEGAARVAAVMRTGEA